MTMMNFFFLQNNTGKEGRSCIRLHKSMLEEIFKQSLIFFFFMQHISNPTHCSKLLSNFLLASFCGYLSITFLLQHRKILQQRKGSCLDSPLFHPNTISKANINMKHTERKVQPHCSQPSVVSAILEILYKTIGTYTLTVLKSSINATPGHQPKNRNVKYTVLNAIPKIHLHIPFYPLITLADPPQLTLYSFIYTHPSYIYFPH